MKLITLSLFALTLFASEFVPKEFAPPPNTKPKDIPPPLTELAEKEGFSAHLAYTNKLNSDVKNIQQQDITEASNIVKGVQDLLKKTAQKAITSNTRAKLEAEKVDNDDGNHAAAGIYMEDKIKKVKSDAAQARDALDVVKADADARVEQAQKDVIAKNDIINSKNGEINQLNDRLKDEADRQSQICETKLTEQSKAKDDQCQTQITLKQDEINSAKEEQQKAEAAVEEAKQKCATDAEAQKEANDQVIAQKEQQMESLKTDISNKESIIAKKDEDRAAAVKAAQEQCESEKGDVRTQEQGACNTEKSKLESQVETAKAAEKKAKEEIVEVENREKEAKNKAIAELQAQLEAASDATINEVRKAKDELNKVCDQRLADLKATDAEALAKQRALTTQALTDSKTNMAKKEEQCQANDNTIKEKIEAKKQTRDNMKAAIAALRLKYNKLKSTVTAQLTLSRKAQEANNAAISNFQAPTTLEEAVAAPASLKTSYSAMAVYLSLICSALILFVLIFKLRGQAVKHKNYSVVLTNAA